MPDYGSPYATNPYLQMPQQEAPDWRMVLANLATGIGTGISQGASSGQGWAAGLAPGIMMGNQLTGLQQQQKQQAQQDQMRRMMFGLQMEEFNDKRAERARQERAIQEAANEFGPRGPQTAAIPGMNVQPSPVRMGPDFTTAATPHVEYLTSKHGLSPLAASTVVGNLYQESGFNPTAVGDSGTAYGMGQWRGDRQTGLISFAKAQGKPPADPRVQLDYLVSEMRGGDMGAQRAYAMLQTAKTPEEATSAMMHFFRPAGYTPANPTAGHGYQNRVQYTNALLPTTGAPPASLVAQGDNVASLPGAPASLMQPSGGPLPAAMPDMRVAQAGGPPVLSSADVPPKLALPPKPELPDADAVRIRRAILAKAMTPEQGRTEARQIVNDLWSAQKDEARTRYQVESEMWRHDRGTRAEQGRHERDLKEKQEARADTRTLEEQKRGDQKSKILIEDENKLRDDFDRAPAVKAYRTVVPMLESAKDAEKRPTRAADLNLIYAMAKLMDPESVVRESEAGMVVATGTISDKLAGYIGQLNGNPTLQPRTRAELIAELDSRFKSLEASYQAHEDAYRGIAERRGYNFDNIRIPIRGTKSGAARDDYSQFAPTQEELTGTKKSEPIRIDMRGKR